MSYSGADVQAATTAMDKYRIGEVSEAGSALVVVGLSAERVEKEAAILDDMIRVAHRAGASIRQLAEVSGLGRKAVTAIISSDMPS
ncbi:MAG TPA: hypothetical protein VGL48_17370 [Acidimicrobiales bacterium]